MCGCMTVCIYEPPTSFTERMPSERHLIIESPEMHFSSSMQSYIAQEVARPCKQWIHEVLCSQRETERVKLRTPHFVVLPDVDTVPSQVFSRLILDRPTDRWQQVDTQGVNATPRIETTYSCNSTKKPPCRDGANVHKQGCSGWLQPIERRWRNRRPTPTLHWLAVATDTSLRTLRDLRGCHIPMLITLYTQTCQKIHEESGTPIDQIMAYVHYPPSVYQLHVHFKHPVGPQVTHDSFRIHPLASIINNLKIDSDYYAKSIIQLPVYSHTELYTALGLPNCGPHKPDQITAHARAPTLKDADPVEECTPPTGK